MAKKAKPKSTAKAKSGKQNPAAIKVGTPDPRLHAFLRDLHTKPKLLQKFNAGDKSRRKVIDDADLSDEHKDLIKKGCVPDILGAMVGAPPKPASAAFTLMIDCCDVMKCGHPECHALTGAAKAKAPQAKKPKK
jgi:hypothetical protein